MTQRDVFFNEATVPLSLLQRGLDSFVLQYAETIKQSQAEGFKKVRYEHGVSGVTLLDGITLYDYCISHSKSSEVKVIMATQTMPYIPDESDLVDAFILEGECFLEQDATYFRNYSMTAAILNDSVGIGFSCNGFELCLENKYKKVQKGHPDAFGYVLCFTQPKQFFSEVFIEWAEKRNFFPMLIHSLKAPKDKEIHLSHHHGTDELKPFAESLLHEFYIEGVINSIDRAPWERKLVHDLHDNMVELRLLNGNGYGLVVSTTAINMRQLRYIAILLERKYGAV